MRFDILERFPCSKQKQYNQSTRLMIKHRKIENKVQGQQNVPKPQLYNCPQKAPAFPTYPVANNGAICVQSYKT